FGQEAAPGGAKTVTATPALPGQVAETPIEDLNLSARAENSLKRAGITKVGQLVTMNPEDLLSIRNFGQKSFVELVERLKMRKLVPDDFAMSLLNTNEE